MGQPQAPYANRGPIEVTSIATAIDFTPPIVWVQVRSAGSGGLTVKTEDGVSHSYTNLVAGDVIVGPFSELTSMTLSRIWYGDGAPPQSTAQSNASINGATVPAGGSLTAGNVLQVTAAGALAYAPVNLGGGANYVTGVAPTWMTAATQTTTFTAAVNTLYYLNFTSAAAVQLPALTTAIDMRPVSFFNTATSTAVITPNGTDLLAVSGAAGATAATAAGPTGSNLVTYVPMVALGKWVKWG